MDTYAIYLSVLATLDLVLVRHVRRQSKQALGQAAYSDTSPGGTVSKEEYIPSPHTPATPEADAPCQAARFRRIYFLVYALVLASDWLQGPYIYQIYHERHQLSSQVVAALFATGFIAAGVSASFAGHFADKHGRKAACLVFCAVAAGSCLSVIGTTNLPVLFFGRILGGLAATLLYTVFDTWMVAEHKASRLEAVLPLSDMFSQSTLLSGGIALFSGVMGECLIRTTRSLASPFVLAVICLGFAATGIVFLWGENTGLTVDSPSEPDAQPSSMSSRDWLRLLVLGAITTVFEGSMYLFVFNWTPSLNSARQSSTTAHETNALPLGLVFGCFMCAMMLGSQLFSIHTQKYQQSEVSSSNSKLMVDTLAIAASALLIPAIYFREFSVFWAFQVFEAAVGVYFPLINNLKANLVPDATRARIYGWFRLPLNIFVVAGLMLTRDGSAENRITMFTTLGGLLLVVAMVARRYL